MNHKKIYYDIIDKSIKENRIKNCGIYYERHHIIPKCLGGNDSNENLVLLTAREHFIVHKLLTYIHKGNRKIAFALLRMTYNKKGKLNLSSKDYAYAKELIKLIPMSEETKQNISENTKIALKSPDIKMKMSINNGSKKEETKQKFRKLYKGKVAWNKGKKTAEETIEKRIKTSEENKSYSGYKNGMYGKHPSQESKNKNSENNKGRIPWNKGLINIYSEETRKIISENTKTALKK